MSRYNYKAPAGSFVVLSKEEELAANYTRSCRPGNHKWLPIFPMSKPGYAVRMCYVCLICEALRWEEEDEADGVQ